MRTTSTHTETLPPDTKETSIISRREIEPLLAKASQILMYYSEAMDCSALLLDRNGHTVKIPNLKKQMCFCELCKKHNHNTFLTELKSEYGKEKKYPCQKIHCKSGNESIRNDEVSIFICEMGFIYWSSPLYRNKRYAGALAAGQVLTCKHKDVLEKFQANCKDRDDMEKFREMLEDVPQKSHAEILAMARILEICAEEISGKGEDPGEMIRRMAWLEKNQKEIRGHTFPWMRKLRHSPETVSTTLNHAGDSDYSLEKERMLLAAYRRGDNETGNRILNELMDSICSMIPLNFEVVRFRVIELLVLLSRAAVLAESSDVNAMFDTNNRYLRRILASKTAEEMTENLRRVAERLSGKIFSFQGIRHASVLRKAERYIWENYTRKISLKEISEAGGLSAPYFSTIFKKEMGENLSSYLNRLRVERAAAFLTETGKSLNEIAQLCGFEDQSWFSKIFKTFTGMSPGKYRGSGNKILKFRKGISWPMGEELISGTKKSEQCKQALLSS